MPVFDNPLIKKILLSTLVFSFSFTSTYAVISPGLIKTTGNSLLALVLGDGGIFSSSLKIKNITLTVGNGLSIPNKVSFTWTGGTKPYFVEFQTSSGWETVGENIEDKKYTHEVPASESLKREYCYRVGYVKVVKSVNTTYVSAPSCVQILPNMIEGDVATSDSVLKFKTVTLYEISDDQNNAYKIVATYSGGKAPYAIHAQSGSRQWVPIGNTAEKTITALVPKTVTNGETNICVMMHYQKTVRNVTTQTVSLPYCTQLLSAVPDGGTGSTGAPVQNIRASNITHYNAKLTWTKSTEDIDGYAVYLEGELVAQTRTNSYTEQPILMPETTYSYAIRTIPKNTTPVEELPEVVGVAANAGIFNLTTKVVPPVPTRGEVKVLVIPVKLSTLTAQLPDSPNELRKKIFTNEDSLANFYNEASFGKIRISGQVVNEIVDVHNYGVDDLEEFLIEKRVFVSVNLKVNKISSVYDPSKYDIVIYNMPAMDGAWGVVDRVTEASGVIKGRIFVNGIKNTHVYAHEFGHKLSFHHAGKSECFDEFSGHLECFEELDVYGDWSDIMSRFALYHPDSWRKAEVGWIRKKEITKNGTYDIIPTENSNSVMHYIERGSEKYYFDYRVPTAMEKNQEFGYEFNGGLYLKSVRYGTVERTGQKYYVTYNLTNTNEPLFNNNRYANFSDFRIWNLKEDQNKATIFVRFKEGSIPTLTATPTQNNTSAVLRWTAIDKAAGYELYRNSTSTAPIYTGNALSFTDTVSGNNKYYVRAYDAFTELPNRKYYMDFSAEASTAISGYDEDPNPSNDPFVWIDNPCPSVGVSPKIVLSGVTELLVRARQNSGTRYIGVNIEHSTTGLTTDWQAEKYNIYDLNLRGNDIYLYQDLKNTGSDHWYRITIESLDNSREWNGGVDIFNNELHYKVGGNCKVAEMKSSALGCQSRVKDIIYKRGTLYTIQTPDFPSSCPFNKLEITNDDLLQPAIITTLPDLNWYDRFDFLNNITLIPSQTGVSVELPYHIQGITGGANTRSTKKRVGTIYTPTLIQSLSERPRR